MMHDTRRGLGEVSYCFSMLSVQFRGHGRPKMPILVRFERFRAVSPSWMHRWLWNDTYLKGAREKVPIMYCFSRPLGQFQGHIGQTRSLGRSQLPLRFALLVSNTNKGSIQNMSMCVHVWKGYEVLTSPKRASGRALLELSRPYFLADHFQTWQWYTLS